ncbi:HAD family hydrolase [Oceanidesulfovibrio marinus]|uniref:HAD family hydrolase n=1 Tax=Oceanidesulfovibrio marinus TaxID=370038 RepID=A0A6P1ZDN1_9BACT|nr:HAD family hydrolase [Oceanidesulfovibrio marinus]TVM32230.1 HAD family hydrolase [Oceanidesulfovibrio marinus]
MGLRAPSSGATPFVAGTQRKNESKRIRVIEPIFISGLLLDLDDTLYAYSPCHEAGLDAALAVLIRKTGRAPDVVADAVVHARKQIHRELFGVAASHNRLLYFQRTLELLAAPGLDAALPAYEAYWTAFLDRMELRPGAMELLTKLPQQCICIVTDLTAHIQHCKLHRLGLLSMIGHLVTSEEVGREKPHPAIFQSALRKLGLPPDGCWVLGDNPAKDLAGAEAAGLSSIWLNIGTAQRDLPVPCLEFSSLLDVARCITHQS